MLALSAPRIVLLWKIDVLKLHYISNQFLQTPQYYFYTQVFRDREPVLSAGRVPAPWCSICSTLIPYLFQCHEHGHSPGKLPAALVLPDYFHKRSSLEAFTRLSWEECVVAVLLECVWTQDSTARNSQTQTLSRIYFSVNASTNPRGW